MQHSGQAKWQLGLRDAGSQQARRTTEPFELRHDVGHEDGEGVGTAVGQGALGEGPHAFIRVELRGVAGEVFEVEAGVPSSEGADLRRGVDPSVVEEHDHRPAQVAQELAQERDHLGLPDVVQGEAVVQAHPVPDRTDGQPRDHRHLIAARPVAQDGRDATRRPRFDDAGDQEEAGFVGKDEVGTQPRRPFFIRGQCTRFQWAIVASSRSSARRSGFWWLQPRRCMRRPT